jgi:excinuclease UvrABC ATPase subunit
VVVIEHHLDVIASADWVIDLGPDWGDAGGQVVAMGPPIVIARTEESRTGEALRVLGDSSLNTGEQRAVSDNADLTPRDP